MVLQPWEINPHKPITWWDMLQFSAKAFFWIGRLTESLFHDCILIPGPGDVPFDQNLLLKPIDPKTKDKAIRTLGIIQSNCLIIGVDISADTASELLDKINKEPDYSYQRLLNAIVSLRDLINREIKGKIFLYLPKEKIKFWPASDKPAFGDQVHISFPSAADDIYEASVSLALFRGTACVFHLMRALEIGLSALGAKFGVSLAHTNWNPAIQEIESKIRNLHNDPAWKSLPDCKDQQEFYAQVASHFGILKDAWRNYTMHSRGIYTEEKAELIYENVKAFMNKLAEGGVAELFMTITPSCTISLCP